MQLKARMLTLAIIITVTLGFQTNLTYAASTSTQEVDVSPKNVKTTSVKYDTIKVSWSAVKGVSNYKVYKSSDKKIWTLVTTTSNKSVKISGLPCQKTKYYKVKSDITNSEATKDLVTTSEKSTVATSTVSTSDESQSESSEETTFVVDKESDVVSGKPLLKSTSVSGHMLSVKNGKLSWKKVAGAQGYKIYQYNKKTKKYKCVKTIKSGKTTSAKISLKKGQTNSFKVSATRKAEGTTVVAKKSSTKKIVVPTVLKKSTPGFSKTNAAKIINKAKTKVGCSYVSGAAGSKSFDCSGYAWWTYKNAGVSTKGFTRSSAQGEYNQLKKYDIGKSLSKAQPGDLVFFSNGGSKSGIYHVAIYYGNNELIHATNPRQGVRVTPVKWYGANNIAGIVRLPNL